MPSGHASGYVPEFFSAQQYALLRAIIDCIIPLDPSGPSATEAGVDEFIDRQMLLPFGHGAWLYLQGPPAPDADDAFGYQLTLTPRELYQDCLEATASAARRLHDGIRFEELSAADQDAFLRLVEVGDRSLGPWPAKPFFNQLLANVREGYFGDPIYGGNRGMSAWKMIGFPGARADFTDWIDRAGAPYPYGPVSLDGSV